MESIEARAFKPSSLSSETAIKSANPQALAVGEECLLVSAAGEDFSVVDEFFDLQGLSEEEGEEEEEKSSSSSSSLSSQDQVDEGSSFSDGLSGASVSGFLSAADALAIPVTLVDDMKELELWSNLMDDTVCDDIFAFPTRDVDVKTVPNVEKRASLEPEIKPATVEAARSPTRVLTKPRSKRLKTASCACTWSSSSSPAPGFTRAVCETGAGDVESKNSGVKKAKDNGATLEEGGPIQHRRCTHCQVQKTPQWRTGPLGPKTLCNACGVRFKSGRLFPEYRPACSPTFSSEIHSNSHRKVLEMRKKKTGEPTGPGLVERF